MLRKTGQHAFSLGNVLWVQTLIQIMVLPVIFFSLGPVALSAWLLYVLVAHVLLSMLTT
jgi:hypothetical protein